MADFTRRRRFSTRRPTLMVDPTLSVGRHVFELVVVDDSGKRSQPVRLRVEVLPPRVTPPPVGPLTPHIDPRITRPPVIR